jgi:hypothetical protein
MIHTVGQIRGIVTPIVRSLRRDDPFSVWFPCPERDAENSDIDLLVD